MYSRERAPRCSEECQNDWKKHKRYHFDLWMGPDKMTPGPAITACENAMTQDAEVFLIDPPSGLPVITTPIYATNGTGNGTCIVPAPPCQDVGNECGNDCQIPKAATCAELAAEFFLTLQRFLALNPTLDCSGTVPAGTSVCMGGTCGG